MNNHYFQILEKGIYAALETYSNVHRGSGQKSYITTELFEKARGLILEKLGLHPGRYTVVFSSPYGAKQLTGLIRTADYQQLSSADLGLAIGVRALVLRKKSLPKGTPVITGGGTTRLISRDWVIWAGLPARFEAGTPSIINCIAFSRALRLTGIHGRDIFNTSSGKLQSASGIIHEDEFTGMGGKELLNALRKERVGAGLTVDTETGIRRFINLDSSASTPTFRPIWEAYMQTLQQPSDTQEELIKEVTEICSRFLGAPGTAYSFLYTANTTEAIHIAAENLKREADSDVEPVVVGSMLEHSSNDLPWRRISEHSILRLSVDKAGFFDLKELEDLLTGYNTKKLFGKKRITLVALSGASNVLGTCNDLGKIGKLVHEYGARFLVDGAQLVAHRSIDMEAMEIDYLACSAHKIYAPFGTGLLVARKDLIRFSPSELEAIRHFGKENAAGIAALGKAITLLERIGMEVIEKEENVLTVRILKNLNAIEGVRLYGIRDPESPEAKYKLGVVSFNLKNRVSFRVGKELAARKGIGVRVGCHCAHITVKHILNVGPGLERFQRVLQTLIPAISFPGVVRVSLGLENTEEDVDELVSGLREIMGSRKNAQEKSASEHMNATDTEKIPDVKKKTHQLYLTRAESVFGQLT